MVNWSPEKIVEFFNIHWLYHNVFTFGLKKTDAYNYWDGNGVIFFLKTSKCIELLSSLIDDRGTSKRLSCAEHRWHLTLKALMCDTGTASGIAWVNGTHGGLQFCRPHKSWAAWCPLIPSIFATHSLIAPRTVRPFWHPFAMSLGTAKWFVSTGSSVPWYLCSRPTYRPTET